MTPCWISGGEGGIGRSLQRIEGGGGREPTKDLNFDISLPRTEAQPPPNKNTQNFLSDTSTMQDMLTFLLGFFPFAEKIFSDTSTPILSQRWLSDVFFFSRDKSTKIQIVEFIAEMDSKMGFRTSNTILLQIQSYFKLQIQSYGAILSYRTSNTILWCSILWCSWYRWTRFFIAQSMSMMSCQVDHGARCCCHGKFIRTGMRIFVWKTVVGLRQDPLEAILVIFGRRALIFFV